jgi:prolyl-tRNA editing enzyme YbaK/EbsC (Cys-tRNA(Pro) deacylase)
VCILQGDRKLDLSAVAALLGVNRKSHQSLRLAHGSELVPLFGFPAGTLGPWGLRSPRETRVVLDEELLQLHGGGVLVGAGAVDVHLAVPPQCIVDACGATVGHIHKRLGSHDRPKS